MSSLKASYTNTAQNTSHVIDIPFDDSKPLTENVINLKDQVNTFLTETLEEEKKSKATSVDEGQTEKKTKEMDEAEDELMEEDQDEDESERVIEQKSKKLKTDPSEEEK